MNTVLEKTNTNNKLNNMITTTTKDTQPKITTIKRKNVDDFLKQFTRNKEKDKDSKPTNTRIGDKSLNIIGGSYTIPDDKYGDFLNVYYDSVLQKKIPEYLTEIQLETDGPILIDIDLRHELSVNSHLYTPDHIHDFINSYLDELKTIYQFDESSVFPLFLFEKSSVKKVPEKNLTKDGIHLIIGIKSDHVTQQILRKRMLKNIAEMWSDLPIVCSWEDVLDEGISTGKVPWQLYGSTKPGFEPYSLTKVVEITFDPNDGEFVHKKIQLDKFNLKENLPQLSARYKGHIELFFKNQFIEERNVFASSSIKRSNPQPSSDKEMEALQKIDLNILQIKNNQDLTHCLNSFLDKIQNPTDYKLREAYDYTMTLPDSYYGTGSYSKWIAVGWALRNIHNNLFIVWIAFSAQCRGFDFRDIRELYEKWCKFDHRNPNGLTERSIMYWSKIDAYDKYKKVRESTVFFHVDRTLEISAAEIVEGRLKTCGDYDLAEVLYELYKDEYVCINIKANIWFVYKNHRWEEIDSGTTLRKSISNEMRDIYQEVFRRLVLEKSLEESEEKQKAITFKIDKIMKICERLARTNDKKNIMTEAKELFYDGQFIQKLDTNPYLLCFNNGVVDFKTKTFRKGYPEDYISKSTKIDYIPINHTRDALKVSEIRDFMGKLFPVKELYNYMWEHLASVLVGTSINQTFHMYIGGGSNGKSVLMTLMEKTIGEYKGDVPLSLITDKRTRIGGLAPELVALKGIRYAVMQEPQKGDKINEGVMKQITSGIDPIQARAPYMPQAITFIPQFDLVLCSNSLMEINSQDHGTWRRVRVVDFMALFTDNPKKGDLEKPYQYLKIDDITEKFDEWKEVFASMLVEKVFETNGFVKDCQIVMKSSNSYRESQDFIAEFVADRILLDPKGTMTKSELKAEFDLWYVGIYGKGLPSMKDVYADMDKRFGKFTEKRKCWCGARINYNREVEQSGDGEDDDGEIEEEIFIDIDVDKL